jgi:CheY-like chemotaxis protein
MEVMMRALVVDDERDVRELMARVLTLAGVEVAQATDGAEALVQLRQGPRHDVVVLDVQMPNVDGWAVLEAMRLDALTADIPVVLCTVKGSRLDVERGWNLGCDAYLTKPFDVDVLVGTVQGVAGRRSAGPASRMGDRTGRSKPSAQRMWASPRPSWLYSSSRRLGADPRRTGLMS